MFPLAKSMVCSWNSWEPFAFDSGGCGHGRPETFVAGRCFPGPRLRSSLLWRSLEALAFGRRGVASVGLCSQRELLVGLFREASRAVLRRHPVVCPTGRNPDRCPLGAGGQRPPSSPRGRTEGHVAHVQRRLPWPTAAAAIGGERCLPH